MSLYLAFKILSYSQKQISGNRYPIIALRCISEQTQMQFSQKFYLSQQTINQPLTISRNGFAVPLNDKIHIKINIRTQTDTKIEDKFYEQILEFGKYQHELSKYSEDIYAEQKVSFDCDQSVQNLQISFKYKISFKKKFGGIAQYVNRNMNFNGKNKNILENTDLTNETELTHEQLDEGIRIRCPWDQYQEDDYQSQAIQNSRIIQTNTKRKLIPESLKNRGIKQGNKYIKVQQKEQNEQKVQKQEQIISHNLPLSERTLVFYKGPCKTKNLFSCMDETVADQQINILQPLYTNHGFL